MLLTFRDGNADDFKSMCKVLKVKENHIGYAADHLNDLIDVGLLHVEDPSQPDSKIRVTEQLGRIQEALGMSLRMLASFDRDRSIVVEPMFGLPEELEKLDVFILMPFRQEMLPVYEDHIKPTCAKLGLSVKRADNFFTAEAVVRDIWAAIASARLLIADCTDRNPNVFYEIGIAHAIGKSTILITQSPEDIPFDLRHLRYIEYELTPRGMKGFEGILDQTMRHSLGMGEVGE